MALSCGGEQVTAAVPGHCIDDVLRFAHRTLYDYVPGYWDGPVGVGFANLVYETYQGGRWGILAALLPR